MLESYRVLSGRDADLSLAGEPGMFGYIGKKKGICPFVDGLPRDEKSPQS
jgi:hypothetical protein